MDISYDMDTQNYKANLEALEKEFSYTLPTISKLTGIDYQRLRNIKYGRVSPTTEEIEAIAILIGGTELEGDEGKVFQHLAHQLAQEKKKTDEQQKIIADLIKFRIEAPELFDDVVNEILDKLSEEIEE